MLYVPRDPRRWLNWIDLDNLYESGMAEKLSSSAASPETLTFGAEIRAAVADGASRLPEPQRDVFALYAGSGLSMAEVARILGLTLPAVKTRCSVPTSECARTSSRFVRPLKITDCGAAA